MKKTAKIFLTIAKILDILAVVGYAIGVILFAIAGSTSALALAAATQDGAKATSEEIATLSAAVAGGVAGTIICAICLVLCVVGLIFAIKASKRLATAKSKAEAKGMAIAAMITGLLSTEFAFVAGILMLCMKDEQYAESEPVEVKAE